LVERCRPFACGQSAISDADAEGGGAAKGRGGQVQPDGAGGAQSPDGGAFLGQRFQPTAQVAGEGHGGAEGERVDEEACPEISAIVSGKSAPPSLLIMEKGADGAHHCAGSQAGGHQTQGGQASGVDQISDPGQGESAFFSRATQQENGQKSLRQDSQ